MSERTSPNPRAKTMTEIPEDVMKAAQELFDCLETRFLSDDCSGKEFRAAKTADLALIARAIMADRAEREVELSRVEKERDEAVKMAQRLYDDFEPPPDPGCTCHISPPCHDCFEHGHTRELLDEAHAFLARMEAKP